MNENINENGGDGVTQKAYSQEDVQLTNGGQSIFFLFGTNYTESALALPERLPPYNPAAFMSARDMILLSTPNYEKELWAPALLKAITRASAWGWSIESTVPLRRRRAHHVLLNNTFAPPFRGWVSFVSAQVWSFLLLGRSVFEIVREGNSPYGQLKALNHLNPLRVVFTHDTEYPVRYLGKNGKVYKLAQWQVGVCVAA
ncbi:MAG: hypothetical protein D6706_16415, partial [Chloroflexi bacterium]